MDLVSVCVNCSKNTSRLKEAAPTPENPLELPPASVTEHLKSGEIAEFFHNWLYLPPRLRDVFVALYVNGFVLVKAARQLKIDEHQIAYARDALRKHEYFGSFFPQ